MRVEVHLYTQSHPVVHTNVVNAYQKGDLYCVMTQSEISKYPLVHIFRIVESYPDGYP